MAAPMPEGFEEIVRALKIAVSVFILFVTPY